jgi:hypothetical protein
MKAYWVQIHDGDWGMYIHAETSGKAKAQYLKVDPEVYGADFVDLSAQRCPDLDDKPFTDDVMNSAKRYVDEEWQGKNLWLEWCSCPLCAAAEKEAVPHA